eukprot:scaffold206050_cov28-Tisochrysis_lutea.AAC.1
MMRRHGWNPILVGTWEHIALHTLVSCCTSPCASASMASHVHHMVKDSMESMQQRAFLHAHTCPYSTSCAASLSSSKNREKAVQGAHNLQAACWTMPRSCRNRDKAMLASCTCTVAGGHWSSPLPPFVRWP